MGLRIAGPYRGALFLQRFPKVPVKPRPRPTFGLRCLSLEQRALTWPHPPNWERVCQIGYGTARVFTG